MSDLHEKYVELMHSEMDGEASPEQLTALREYLASHPEAQNVRAELAKLTDALNQVEKIEAPADLHKNIMKALPRRRSVVEIGLWKNRSRLGIPWIRYGYALAAGVLLGAVLTGLAFKNLSPVEKSDVYGTMASLQNARHYAITEQMKLAAPNLDGTVEVSRSGDREMVVFDMNTAKPVEVEMRFDGSGAGLTSFSQQPNSIASFVAKEGRISFRSEGKQNSTLILANEKSGQLSLNLRFYVEGKLVHEATVGVGGTLK